jgi:hypothetical protein
LRFVILNSFDQSFSFFDYSWELISSHISTIEACKCITTSSLINNKFNFSPSKSILIRSKISLNWWYNSSSNTVFDFSWKLW